MTEAAAAGKRAQGKKGLRDTLKFRMIVIAVGVHLGIWFIAAVASSVTAVNVILDAQDKALKTQADFVDFASRQFIGFVESLDLSLGGELGGRSIALTRELGWSGNPMVYWNMQGRQIHRTANAPNFDPPVAAGFTNETILASGREVNWRVYYKPVRDTFWVAVGIDTQESRQAIVSVGLRALFPMALIIPLTILGIYLGTMRGLRPMQQLADAVAARSPVSLEPIDTTGIHQELQPMLGSLNDLLGQLSEALENEHRFTANAAHELQTPLTAIKAELQMRQRNVTDPETREILSAIGVRVDRAVYTVRQLLTLARLEALGTKLSMDEVDLHQVVEQALADHGHLVVDRSLALEFPEDEQWPVRGQGETLAILVGNLLANAFNYTPEGGRIALAAHRASKGLVFAIANDCASMTEAEREALVDRFYRRPGNDSPGAGLGLSIVQRIAQVHGAELTLSPWENGEGLLVTVSFMA